MDKVDELIIDVTLRQNGFGRLGGRNIAQEMEEIALAEKKVISANNKLEKSNRRVAQSGVALGKAFKTLSAYLGVRELIKYSDEWTNIEAKLKLITKTDKERVALQEKLYNISKKTRQSMSGSTDLFQKLTLNTQSMGLSTNLRTSLTDLISKALTVGKGTPESNKALLLQFGQALGIGKFAGQDLKSIMQNNSYFASQIAKGLGVNVGDLPKMGAKGELTSEMVLGAILKQRNEINRDFEKTPKTISEAMQVFSDSVGKFVNGLNQATKLSEKLAKVLVVASDNIELIAGGILTAFIPSIIKSIPILHLFVLNLKDGLGLFKAMKYSIIATLPAIKGFVLSAKAIALPFLKWYFVLKAILEVIKLIKGEANVFESIGEKVGNWFSHGTFENESYQDRMNRLKSQGKLINVQPLPTTSNLSNQNSNTNINQNVTFNINEASNPKAIASEVDRIMSTRLTQAGAY